MDNNVNIMPPPANVTESSSGEQSSGTDNIDGSLSGAVNITVDASLDQNNSTLTAEDVEVDNSTNAASSDLTSD